MEITASPIGNYLHELTPERSAVLAEMEKYAAEQSFPIVGPLCGRFLQQMAMVVHAKRIFEMGSGFGYSAIWFALGIPDNGKIICTDGNESRRDRALSYFEKAGVSHKIEFHVGLAQDVLKTFNEPFDIILNDVDKDQYPDVPDIAIPHLRSGGMLITDNALWGTRVVNPDANDEDTEGVREYNRVVYNRKDIFTTLIPLRDGLALSVKY